MVLDSYFAGALVQDVVAAAITFALALAWLRSMDRLAARGVIESRLSRKVIHIGTGPLFVLCWFLYSPAASARWAAALVPLAITAQFALVGLGRVRDEAAVQALTRTGDRREILRGPLVYGLVFVLCPLAFWRTSPAGIAALMILCGGDGLADVVGRRFGRRRLPHNPTKSWVGSAAMFLGGFVLAAAMLLVFQAGGLLRDPRPVADWLASVAIVAAGSTIVESLPVRDLDNLTISATAVALGLLVF